MLGCGLDHSDDLLLVLTFDLPHARGELQELVSIRRSLLAQLFLARLRLLDLQVERFGVALDFLDPLDDFLLEYSLAALLHVCRYAFYLAVSEARRRRILQKCAVVLPLNLLFGEGGSVGYSTFCCLMRCHGHDR